MSYHSYNIIVIIALILWIIYRRVRRNIGWQHLNQKKLVFRTILFFIIGLLFLTGGISHPISLISDMVGIILGIILAYYGSRITSFEQRDGQLFYRPNVWIGSVVMFLFLARLIYRFYGVFAGEAISKIEQGQPNDFQNIGYISGNSWTSGLLLIMFSYYIFYYMTLLKKQKQMSLE
ncbi:DUF1453 family protein [Heyndrickxia camelliae]|uniref:DUF1453 domain-containing protein n=1 Tax=Heyndrickxia camelliae TaxID=1707093 RepID=A0A2N3LIL7_9BACI|nr:DUF1453 family protein [Heyndrickxia camelliae]PKR84446.1 hypothetical protein CWO92_13740 [Heyndrickxia camelliae]